MACPHPAGRPHKSPGPAAVASVGYSFISLYITKTTFQSSSPTWDTRLRQKTWKSTTSSCPMKRHGGDKKNLRASGKDGAPSSLSSRQLLYHSESAHWLDISSKTRIRLARCESLSIVGLHRVTRRRPRLTRPAAPVISNVGISYHQEQFNGSFLNENIYRQDAGPEVDAAWKSLGADCEFCLDLSVECRG